MPKKVSRGDYIQASVTAGSTMDGYYAANLTGIYGISGDTSCKDTHDNHPEGLTMWLSENKPGRNAWLIFDLGAVYPVGEMYVWNYNQFDPRHPEIDYTGRGMKNVTIEYSIDKINWTELKGPQYPYRFAKADGSEALPATNLDDGKNSPVDFGGVSARYIRITPAQGVNNGNWGGKDGKEEVYGLSKVRFYVGRGLMVEPAEEWTKLFHRYSGWTGSDGIYTIPLSGFEKRGSAATTKTLINFSDTFIDEMDRSGKRSNSWIMINNSLALLTGAEPDPEKIRFIWGTGGTYQRSSVYIPDTPSVRAMPDVHCYYWLGDGIAINNRVYHFTMLVRDEPEGPEGFKFSIFGVTLISVPIGQDGPELGKCTQIDTPLYHRLNDGTGLIVFGCAVMPNTVEAGAPNPDGYVYVYGYMKKNDDDSLKLVAARIAPENFDKLELWRYWDGEGWCEDIDKCAPITSNISHEMSVTPMEGGLFDGKYLAVFHKDVKSGIIACRVGETPVGPFGDIIPLYYTPELEQGHGIFVYHAKAHPHLSKPDELLVSYNVNTVSLDMHLRKGDIYRPRFIRLREIL